MSDEFRLSETDARRQRLLRIVNDWNGPLRGHGPAPHGRVLDALREAHFTASIDQLRADVNHLVELGYVTLHSGVGLMLTTTGREVVALDRPRAHWRCSASDCGCGGGADDDGCCASCGAQCAECECGVRLDLGGGAWLTLPASAALRPEAVSALHAAARALVAALAGDAPRLLGVRPPAEGAHLGATEAS